MDKAQIQIQIEEEKINDIWNNSNNTNNQLISIYICTVCF